METNNLGKKNFVKLYEILLPQVKGKKKTMVKEQRKDASILMRKFKLRLSSVKNVQ